MTASWLRWFTRAPAGPQAWRLLVDGAEFATLRDPRLDDTFWTSFEIVASTAPPDPRLRDDAFWLGEGWKIVDAATGRAASLAIASSAGLRDGGRRVVLRGLHLD